MTESWDERIDRVLHLEGEEYLDAEAEVRRNRNAAQASLERAMEEDPDPFVRYVARAVLELPRDEAVLEEVEEFLVRTERRLAGSPTGGPRPDVVAEDLSHLYGPRLVGYFAIRLVKEDAEWPGWKTEGVLRYVAEEGGPDVVPALVRYASISNDPHFRQMAVDAVGRFPEVAPAAWARESRFWHLKAAAARKPE